MTLSEIKEFQKNFDLQFRGNIEFHEEIDNKNIFNQLKFTQLH